MLNRLKSKYKRYKIKKNKKEGGIYQPDTEITFIVQFFNSKKTVEDIYNIVSGYPKAEVIFIDDGSVDGSLNKMRDLLQRKNDFILRANDIYEVRTYSKAIRLANSPIVCLMQDDDIPPDSLNWINGALDLFKRYKDLIVLGGRNGLTVLEPEPIKDEVSPTFYMEDGVCSFPGHFRYKLHQKPTLIDPETELDFMFCMTCNRAPTFIRRQEFLNIGGIDQDFAPYQCDDVDYCLRAWKAGYHVGLYNSDFKIGATEGGMRTYQGEERHHQILNNWKKIYDKHQDILGEQYLRDMIHSLNQKLIVNKS